MKTKSAIVKKFAKKQGLKVINFKLSKCPVEDITGHPLFIKVHPTLKEWVAWAKKEKIDPVIQAFVKRHGMKHARLAVSINNILKGMNNA